MPYIINPASFCLYKYLYVLYICLYFYYYIMYIFSLAFLSHIVYIIFQKELSLIKNGTCSTHKE